ncbi:MAG: lipocalin-like domain-containing protein [Rhodothermales bacterium]
MLVPALVILLAAAAGVVWYMRPAPPVRPSVDVGTAIGQDTVGYARAYGPRSFRFPEDHGAHPDFKLEWWYYTGNVTSADGRRFGYQFTIFRNALSPPDTSKRATDWATNQLYMGHLALTDLKSGKFYAFERFSRGAAGLAGAQPQPFRVWLDDWEITQPEASMPPMRIRASEQGVRLDLKLEAVKPMVLQGDRGYSVKGPGAGNASYYYSYTRLRTTGRIETPEGSYDVRGASWMDREWSTSLLNKQQAGWDWFSFQLSDGRELMYFVVRERDAGSQPYTDGVLVQMNGTPVPLDASDVILETTNTWKSPLDGATYPAGWRLQVPSERIDLNVTPIIANQELDLSIRYWEGAVDIRGTAAGRPVDGQGYVELTGYSTSTRSFDRELTEEELREMPPDWKPGGKAPSAAPPPAEGGGAKGGSSGGSKEAGTKRKN